jgi:hypothetical protein
VKRSRLQLLRQLERRTSPSLPICRSQSRNPALYQRRQDLPDKRVGHVSFPTKSKSGVYNYYAGYQPTLAVEDLSKAASNSNTQGKHKCSEVNTSGRFTPLRSTPLRTTPPRSTPLNKETTPKHWITTTIQLPTLICDVVPACSYPHISMAKVGLTHSGQRRSTRKEYLVRWEICGLSITSGHRL